MCTRFVIFSLLTGCMSMVLPADVSAESGISTITNRTSRAVQLTVLREDALPLQQTLAAGKRIQLSTAKRAVVQIGRLRTSLAANMNYEIRQGRTGAIQLHMTGRRTTRRRPSTTKQPPSKSTPQSGPRPNVGALSPSGSGGSSSRPAKKTAIVPIKILVDEEERATRKLWERRLRDRIDNASDILEAHCGVRLKVIAVGQWDSDDRTTDFSRSLREFEQEVDPGPARLAIGFTSQFAIVKGRTNLGGTRGPLHSHILIREWSHAISEPERLEVLLHEVGHYLGAPHSTEANSVMRPVLGDRKSRSIDFEIRYDDTSTTIMNLMAGEIRQRRVRKLSDLTPLTRATLRKHYVRIAKKDPKDPAARRFVYLIDRASAVAP